MGRSGIRIIDWARDRMIHIKRGVRIHGIMPEIVLALVVADQVYTQLGHDLVVTSVIDGKHMRASIHYIGGAVDLRLPGDDGIAARNRIALRLGGDYDVILESNHIHVEWQPKGGY